MTRAAPRFPQGFVVATCRGAVEIQLSGCTNLAQRARVCNINAAL